MALTNNNYNKAVLDKVNRPHNKRASNNQSAMVFFLVIGVVLVIIIGLVMFGSGDDNSSEENNTPEVSVTPSPTLEPIDIGEEETENREIVQPITGETDDKPAQNTLYYSFHSGQDTIFYLPESAEEDDESSTLGQVSLGDYTSIEEEYDSLLEPIRLAKLDVNLAFVVDFYIAPDNSYMLVSLIDRASELIQNNQIIKIDLVTKSTSEVWSRVLFDESYDGFSGAVSIDEIIDDWIQAEVAQCFECDGDIDFAKLIINTKTGSDTLLGDVSNIIFDIEADVVEYSIDGETETTSLP